MVEKAAYIFIVSREITLFPNSSQNHLHPACAQDPTP